MNILHYGMQRSGTNYIEQLLKKNYRVKFLNRGKDRSSPLHKHFRLYKDKNIIPEPQYLNDIVIENFEEFERLFEVLPDYYLVISKDPYSWYLSYINWAQKCNWQEVNHHYIQEYNFFYGKFQELSCETKKVVFVRYVDLIRDSDAVLNQLESRMRLKKKLFARRMMRRVEKVSKSSRFTDDRRTYYLEEKYLDKLSKDDLHTLNSHLDPTVVSQLGYEMRGVVN